MAGARVVAGSVVLLVAGTGFGTAAPAQVGIERRPATWQLTSVDDLRFLELTYESGGCRLGNGSATVRETATRIRIGVQQDEIVAVNDDAPVCTQELVHRQLTVVLKRPVGGRRVVGGPRIRAGLTATRVPGVLDLARRDAYTVLESQGFEVRPIGKPSGTAAFQTPLAGRRAPSRTVGVTFGRELFPAKRLKACLSRAGPTTIAKRPKPGDADAPDLEFRLYTPSLTGFVALYADPARAREHAPSIRRRTRQFHGRFERRRRAIIVWVRWPGDRTAAAVRRCATGRLARVRLRTGATTLATRAPRASSGRFWPKPVRRLQL